MTKSQKETLRKMRLAEKLCGYLPCAWGKGINRAHLYVDSISSPQILHRMAFFIIFIIFLRYLKRNRQTIGNRKSVCFYSPILAAR